jgi:hypothetical protein
VAPTTATPAGNDSTGNGSISSPYLTLARAESDVPNGTGKTILMRGGTYYEYFSTIPFSGKIFSTTDSVHISSYPGEWAIIDCEHNLGKYLRSSGYVIIDNLELRNVTLGANDNYGGIYATGNYGIVKRAKVNGCDWPDTGNTSGICLASGAVVDSCDAEDNYDSTPSTAWNSSNYNMYGDRAETAGDAFIISCYSGGYSPVGYKVKHGGDGGKLHITSRYRRAPYTR